MQCDENVGDVGVVDFEMLVEVDVIDAIVSVCPLGPADGWCRGCRCGEMLGVEMSFAEGIEGEMVEAFGDRLGMGAGDGCDAPAAGYGG